MIPQALLSSPCVSRRLTAVVPPGVDGQRRA